MRLTLATAALLLSTTALAAQDFPQTFEHRYGTTVIEEAPERVVSLSYQNADNLLALGVVPVGIRYWYGDYPNGVWPWADAALGDNRPVVLTGDVNIEAVAALEPDVIEALWSGLTQEQYDLLSQIAPVVVAEAQYGDYGTPWDVIIQTTGRITGREAEATAQLDALKAGMAGIGAAHPDWAGATIAIGNYWDGSVATYGDDDIRMTLMHQLGLATAPGVLATVPDGEFYMNLSAEDLSALDADVLIWFVEPGDLGTVGALPLRTQLDAHAEGREILSDDLLTSAFSHASLLSIPYVLDRLVPEIELAIDGDPATPVPSAVAAGFAP